MEATHVSNDIYTPGDKICCETSAKSGNGTIARDGFIYATLLGKVKIESDKTESKSLPTISITTQLNSSVFTPNIGSVVTARIKSVNLRFAKCTIFAVNNCLLKDQFRGQINRKEIRASEKDKIEVYKSFRTGDIVLARVISLGDSNSYLLSCAENELGVIIGYGESGAQLLPIAWNQMQCPITLQKEYRKVAKVQPDYIKYVKEDELIDDIKVEN